MHTYLFSRYGDGLAGAVLHAYNYKHMWQEFQSCAQISMCQQLEHMFTSRHVASCSPVCLTSLSVAHAHVPP